MPDHAILTPEAHRDMRVRTDAGEALGDALMCALVVPDEFRRVQGDYPILFRLDLETGTFAAFAMFGFENGENLFLSGDRWDADYRPLSTAIQPFLIGGSPADADTKQVHVDLASPRLAPDGVRVFDEDGRPTPYLEDITEKLGQLDQGYRASAGFFDALKRHALLEPLTLEITLDDGSTNRLVGFHTIDEDKLAALDAASLADLHVDGYLMPIFMAVASIGRLNTLVDRKNRKVRGG